MLRLSRVSRGILKAKNLCLHSTDEKDRSSRSSQKRPEVPETVSQQGKVRGSSRQCTPEAHTPAQIHVLDFATTDLQCLSPEADRG